MSDYEVDWTNNADAVVHRSIVRQWCERTYGSRPNDKTWRNWRSWVGHEKSDHYTMAQFRRMVAIAQIRLRFPKREMDGKMIDKELTLRQLFEMQGFLAHIDTGEFVRGGQILARLRSDGCLVGVADLREVITSFNFERWYLYQDVWDRLSGESSRTVKNLS